MDKNGKISEIKQKESENERNFRIKKQKGQDTLPYVKLTLHRWAITYKMGFN